MLAAHSKKFDEPDRESPGPALDREAMEVHLNGAGATPSASGFQ